MNFDEELLWEERIHKGFFLPFYEKRGWKVIEDNLGKNTPYDVKIEKDGRTYRINEKATHAPRDGMTVELSQNVADPKGSWLHHDKEVYLYAECREGSEEVVTLHSVSHQKLCTAIFDKGFWKTNMLRPMVSLGGYGITIIVAPRWEVLVKEGIAANIPV
jgi:hypothetical protein